MNILSNPVVHRQYRITKEIILHDFLFNINVKYQNLGSFETRHYRMCFQPDLHPYHPCMVNITTHTVVWRAKLFIQLTECLSFLWQYFYYSFVVMTFLSVLQHEFLWRKRCSQLSTSAYMMSMCSYLCSKQLFVSIHVHCVWPHDPLGNFVFNLCFSCFFLVDG